MAATPAARRLGAITDDVGQLGAALGYDAMVYDDIVVVFSRAALVVADLDPEARS
ncbi:MAG: hypothetical protein ACT4RN_19540 [Pseudonocardia sp.]